MLKEANAQRRFSTFNRIWNEEKRRQPREIILSNLLTGSHQAHSENGERSTHPTPLRKSVPVSFHGILFPQWFYFRRNIFQLQSSGTEKHFPGRNLFLNLVQDCKKAVSTAWVGIFFPHICRKCFHLGKCFTQNSRKSLSLANHFTFRSKNPPPKHTHRV